jgi:hypothetical protein
MAQIFGSFQGPNGVIKQNIDSANVSLGDVWFDHANAEIKINDGSSWVDVGSGGGGDKGYTGSQGFTGSASTVIGFTGSQGDAGTVGFTGSQGDAGTVGFTGSKGDQGDVGFTGSKGDQGDVGFTGSIGDQGLIGFTGSKGDTGFNGSTGFGGSAGAENATLQSVTDNGSTTTNSITANGGVLTGNLTLSNYSVTSIINDGTFATASNTSLASSASTKIYVDAAEVAGELALGFSKAAGLAVEQDLYARAGQPGFTVLAVGPCTSGKVQGCSLGAGNVVEVYASGADYENANVIYREFMGAGEPICFTGLSTGAIITSTQGFYGMAEQVEGSQESPMPLLSLGLSFNESYCYAFRNSENLPTFLGGSGNNVGQVTIINGALPSVVTFTRGGNTVGGQTPKSLDPFEACYFYTDSNGEFFISATAKVMACIQANMGSAAPELPSGTGSTNASFYDARLIMPLTNDGMTWPRSGFVSAPYDNTESKYYVRDGATGDFPTVNPGSPVDFDAGTGATDSDYEPNGLTRLKAVGLVSAYSGADSAGLEATPMIPVSALSQVVAQPFFINDTGDGGSSGVAIGSPYTGTAKVYRWDTTSNVAVLAYTVELNRGSTGQGITPSTPEDQYIPCAGIVANEGALTGDTGYAELVGNLDAGYIVADVPITVVAQNATPSYTPTLRSQNGTTTSSIVSSADETLFLGVTPPELKAEIMTDTSGFTRKRVVDGSGNVTYSLT